jgi:uncharacterized protein (DUF1330 family)
MGEVRLLVQLWAHLDQGADLADIEDGLVDIASRHGAVLERRDRAVPLEGFSGDAPPPDEVHVITFPSMEALRAYVDDPARAEVASRLPGALAARSVWILDEL